MRLSTPKLFEAVSKTLVNLGAEVVDLGLVSTPSLYFAVFTYKYAGGIQITASHNPKDYNGLKMVVYSPKGLIKIGKNTGMDQIKEMTLRNIEFPKTEGGRLVKKENILSDEINSALKIVGNPELKSFRIVADAANAMGALYIEELFKKIPGQLIKMNFNLDGTFPSHQADPLNHENLKDLQKRVIEERADLGLAPDGDGDILFFIDYKDKSVPPSIITALIAREILKKQKGKTIIVDIRYIMTPKKIIEESEGIFALTRVGHAFISEKMKEIDAVFAGESSSHYFFKETGSAEAQIPVILFVLKVMTQENKSLSELVTDLRRSHESGEINFEVNNANELMDIIRKEYSDGEVSEMDGITVDYPEWRFSLRTSNTEPLLRLNIESRNAEDVQNKKEEIISIIEEHKITS